MIKFFWFPSSGLGTSLSAKLQLRVLEKGTHCRRETGSWSFPYNCVPKLELGNEEEAAHKQVRDFRHAVLLYYGFVIQV